MEIKVFVLVLLAVIAAGTGVYFFGNAHDYWNAPVETQEPATPSTPSTPIVVVVDGQQPATPQPVITTASAVPVETLGSSCKDRFTMAAVTTGNLSFYTPGADVKDPYITSIDQIDCGGSTTDMLVQTNTGYDIHYDGSGATYYDELLSSWNINYNPETGKGTLLSSGLAYHAVSPVGALVEYSAASLPEIQSGLNDTGAGALYYDESGLGGSGWFDMDIGNNNANSELKDVVMCFRDNDGDMEGNEITSFTASYVSGTTAIAIPGSLQTYWEDAMGGAGAQCFTIASTLGSSQKARWQFTVAVAEANFDTTEEFEITFDDLGQYLEKQYPSRNAKASAASLTVGDQA